jgi:F-type H+-transporting ATPase subunit b
VLDLLAAAGHAAAEHGAEAAHPEAFGMGPGFFVALAMLVVLGIMLWAGVPGIVAKLRDDRIGAIRRQLDEAKALRAEAAALRDDYLAKTKAADEDIAQLKTHAEQEAARIVEKAKADAAALIARHKALSADKIAAAERAAIDELRAKAAQAAAAAAAQLIAEQHGEADDRKLADEIISKL